MINIKSQTRQAYVDFAAIEARRTGRIVGRFTGAIAQQRAYLTTTLERLGERGSETVMVPTYAELEFHAHARKCEITPLGAAGKAVLVREQGPDQVEQVWVLAAARGYRDHMLAYLERFNGPVRAAEHESAATCISHIIAALDAREIRPELPATHRASVRALLAAQQAAHAAAAAAGTPDAALFDYLDSTVDADHVFAHSKLLSLPEAWVLLLPVPAPANREFGAKIEAKYAQAEADRGEQELSAEMLLKVLAGFVPSTEKDLAVSLDRVRNQLDPGIHHRYLPRMEAVMKAAPTDGLQAD